MLPLKHQTSIVHLHGTDTILITLINCLNYIDWNIFIIFVNQFVKSVLLTDRILFCGAENFATTLVEVNGLNVHILGNFEQADTAFYKLNKLIHFFGTGPELFLCFYLARNICKSHSAKRRIVKILPRTMNINVFAVAIFDI